MEPSTGAQQLDLELLRDRFAEIAAHRVHSSVVEDIVHDALKVVVEKGGQSPDLGWCFQVLRNVIGNHYRRDRTRNRFVVPAIEGETDVPGSTPTPLESLENDQTERLFESGIESLGEPCSSYLSALAQGATPAAIADEASLEPAVFYRRLYRCRQKLRQWLETKGVIA